MFTFVFKCNKIFFFLLRMISRFSIFMCLLYFSLGLNVFIFDLNNVCFSRHILFTESSVDNYAGSSFPGLTDAMFEIDKLSQGEAAARWQIVKKHYSVILFAIQSAASTLKDVTDFMYQY